MTDITRFQSSFFRLHTETQAVVLTLTREQLTEEENLEQLDQDFISLVDTYQVRNVILDMTSVGYLTSSAIGKLISLHRRLARTEGNLVICSLTPEVEHILDTSHLLGYFSIVPTTEAALNQMG